MTTFVLVSGAWHAGWCWERVTPLLEAQGHKALRPDLFGMGPDPTPLSQVTLAGWADQVADLVRAQREPVVLVGHSRGGIVISEVAERVPEHIQQLVYLAAFLLPNGVSLSSAMPDRDGKSDDLLRPGPDNTTTISADRVGQVFYNSTSAEWVKRAAELLTPEPMAVFATPLRLSDARFGQVRRAYIECELDRAVPLKLQRSFQTQLPCEPVISLATDHSPFYSAPEELAAALHAIGRRSNGAQK
jgi:pimeloyl-ACP methyl ester carboxylesterase